MRFKSLDSKGDLIKDSVIFSILVVFTSAKNYDIVLSELFSINSTIFDLPLSFAFEEI